VQMLFQAVQTTTLLHVRCLGPFELPVEASGAAWRMFFTLGVPHQHERFMQENCITPLTATKRALPPELTLVFVFLLPAQLSASRRTTTLLYDLYF